MTAELDLAGLKTMLAEATPGDWTAHRVPGHADLSQIEATMPDGSKACVSCDTTDNDAPFIAAVKNSLPKLIQRIEELEEALRPFAEAAEAFDDCEQHPTGCPDSAPAGELVDLTVGDFRRARAALTPNEGR